MLHPDVFPRLDRGIVTSHGQAKQPGQRDGRITFWLDGEKIGTSGTSDFGTSPRSPWIASTSAFTHAAIRRKPRSITTTSWPQRRTSVRWWRRNPARYECLRLPRPTRLLKGDAPTSTPGGFLPIAPDRVQLRHAGRRHRRLRFRRVARPRGLARLRRSAGDRRCPARRGRPGRYLRGRWPELRGAPVLQRGLPVRNLRLHQQPRELLGQLAVL